jgi:DivIVA domain-containing protein
MDNDNDAMDVVETEEARHFTGIERNLGVSPIDMRQRTFATTMRGYDRQEVTAFLSEAAADYEGVLRENDRLRQDIVRLKTSLAQFRELEGSLKSMLISAQKIADDMKENAVQESARIVSEAEARAVGAEGAGQARSGAAGNRRTQNEAPRSGDQPRGDDLDAPRLARVRARAGAARSRREQRRAAPAARRRLCLDHTVTVSSLVST